MNLRKTVLGSVTSVLIGATLSVVQVPAAHAAQEFDLYQIRSPGLRVNTGSCRYVTITARTDAPRWITDVDAYVDVRIAGNYVDSVWLEEHPNPRKLRGHYYYCPSLDEVGTYKLGATEVTWYDEDWNSGSFIDRTRGTMKIKQATRARFAATRTGKIRHFTARPLYQAAGYGWYRFPSGTRINLQRRSADGTGPWKRVGVDRVNQRGVVTFKVRANKVREYRVTARGTARSWPLRSLSLLK